MPARRDARNSPYVHVSADVSAAARVGPSVRPSVRLSRAVRACHGAWRDTAMTSP